jgi:hypothetical protein
MRWARLLIGIWTPGMIRTPCCNERIASAVPNIDPKAGVQRCSESAIEVW